MLADVGLKPLEIIDNGINLQFRIWRPTTSVEGGMEGGLEGGMKGGMKGGPHPSHRSRQRWPLGGSEITNLTAHGRIPRSGIVLDPT